MHKNMSESALISQISPESVLGSDNSSKKCNESMSKGNKQNQGRKNNENPSQKTNSIKA